MKETCVLIGYGNWGKRIYPSLKKNFKVVKIIKSKDIRYSYGKLKLSSERYIDK